MDLSSRHYLYDVSQDLTEENLNRTLRGAVLIVHVRCLWDTPVLKVVFAPAPAITPAYVTRGEHSPQGSSLHSQASIVP